MRRTSAADRIGPLIGTAVVSLLLVASVASAPVSAAPSSSPSPSSSASTDQNAGGKKKASAGEQHTYGIGPANKTELDRRGVFTFAAKPGATIEDQVALVNYTLEPRKVRVYPADGFTTDDGVFDVLAADKPSTDIGSWFDLTSKVVTIPARKSVSAVRPGTLIVPFRVTVPENATPGDHVGGIVVSVRTDPAVAGNSVVVDRRVGTRVYLQVAGALTPKLEVTGLKASYSDAWTPWGRGSTRVEYVVRNTGNTVLSARQSTRVEDWFSDASPATAQPDLTQLLPGAAVSVGLDVPGSWPTFRPEAVVTLVPYRGLAASPVDLAPVTASSSFWAVPWALLVTILILLLLGHLTWRFVRHQRSRPPARHGAPKKNAPTELVPTP